MPRVNPEQQAQAIGEALKEAEQGYYQIDEQVQRFCQTWESQLQQLASILQKVEQEEQNFEGDVDQSLKQLEQEVAQSQGLWAALAPGNKLAQKEQVSQKRLALLNTAKKLRQTMQEASQELSAILKDFQENTRQLQKDFTPLKQHFQALAKSLDQLQNGLQSQQARAVADGAFPPGPAAARCRGRSAVPGRPAGQPEQGPREVQGQFQGGAGKSQQQPGGGVWKCPGIGPTRDPGVLSAAPGSWERPAEPEEQFIMASLQQVRFIWPAALEQNRVLSSPGPWNGSWRRPSSVYGE